MNKQDLRQQMIANAKAYNKTLTNEYLEKQSDNALLCFTGPFERGDFANELRKIEALEREEVCDE